MLGIFETTKMGTVSESLIVQPEEICTDGDDGRIQRIKRSRNTHLQSSDCRWEGQYMGKNKTSAEVFNLRNRRRCGLIAFVSRFESFFICGSFTWLYYNRTKILENQTLLLVLPGGLLVRLFKNSWRGLFCDSVKSCHWSNLNIPHFLQCNPIVVVEDYSMIQLPIQFCLITKA